jgi:CrcB protein
MRKYYLIGIGGFFGAVLRYVIREFPHQSADGLIPVDTLLINAAGAFLLAFIFRTATEYWDFDADLRLGICTGFLGAFTTFSTLCKEATMLTLGGNLYPAVLYIALSAFIGIGAAFAGCLFAGRINKSAKPKNNDTARQRIVKREED